MNGTQVRILVVCEGNLCRSPAGERLLRHYLTPAAAVEVSSAGTDAVVGQSIYPPVADVLKALGVDGRGHVSRQLDARMIREADVILTATRAQASAVVTADVTALRRTFTLLGLTRLVHDLPPRDQSAPGAWPLWLAANRGRTTALHLPSDDIPDPFGADLITVRRAIEEIAEACRVIARSYRP